MMDALTEKKSFGSSISTSTIRDKPLEALPLDTLFEATIAIYCDSQALLRRIRRQRQRCILRRLKPLEGAKALNRSLREGAKCMEEQYTEFIGISGFGYICRDGPYPPIEAWEKLLSLSSCQFRDRVLAVWC